MTQPVPAGPRRQGDLLAGVTTIQVVGAGGASVGHPCPRGVVVVSQTCDVVLDKVLHLQVAPLVELPEDVAAGARGGDRPRYAHLPALGLTSFADLEIIGTVHKDAVADKSVVAGVLHDNDVRRLGQEIGRRYSRFAFPDPVVAWLGPLEAELRAKARKEQSPLGVVLQEVVEIRAEAVGGWTSTPHTIGLTLVLQPGALPTFPDDDIPECPADLRGWLVDVPCAEPPSTAEAARRLTAVDDLAHRYWAWELFARALAHKCRPRDRDAWAEGLVASVTADVSSADDYPLTRFRRSERLDLELLSPPYPS